MADDEVLGILELEDNLADVERPPELPPGVYTGEVQDVQTAVSGKGNNYFSIKFVVPQDQLPADIREHYEDGAILYWNRQVVPKRGDRRALFNLRKFIEALGLDTNTSTIDPNDWMGKSARLRVRTDKWQGEDRAQIQAVEAAEPSAPARRREPEPVRQAAAGGRRTARR